MLPSRKRKGFMDNNNENPSHAKEPAMDAGDWKSQLPADARQRIVNKILETLKRHLPFSGQEGLAELKEIAVRFEEKIYDRATSQSDYLRKISLKVLTMETKTQNTMTNSSESNSAGSSGMQPQVSNEGQLSSENIQSNILSAGVENSAALSSALPPYLSMELKIQPSLVSAQAPTPYLNMSALQSALPPAPGITMPATSQQGMNMSSSSFEQFPVCGVIQSDTYAAFPSVGSQNIMANYQRKVLEWQQEVKLLKWQQEVPQQPQQQSEKRIYQQPVHGQLLQSHIQRQQLQQQMLSQKTPLPSSQQSRVKSAFSVVQSSLSKLQQSQQSAISYLTESMIQQAATPQQHQEQLLNASVDCTGQMGDKIGTDWREEVYEKIKVMKEMYLTKLSELYQKNAAKLQQLESLPQQPKLYQLEKLKMHKTMQEHLITVLQVSKSNISPVLKGKLGLYEKQIIGFINTNKPKKSESSLQQGQLPSPPSMEHSQSQITQVKYPENQMNTQIQSMNLQSSVATVLHNDVTSLQKSSVPSISEVSTAQESMMFPLQPNSNMDPGQGTALNSLQQVPEGLIQQTNMNALSSQNELNMLQNFISLQSNSGILHSQHLNQQEHQSFQNQVKQLYQQRQMQVLQQYQQGFLPRQQYHQQQQQLLQQQLQLLQQQLQQKAKQQLPGQLQAYQMPQLHQISGVNDVKIRPGMGDKPGAFSQHMSVPQISYQTQLNRYQQYQMKQQLMQKQQIFQKQQPQEQLQQLKSLLSNSNADPGQGDSLKSLQQVHVNSTQETPLSCSQQTNMNAMSSQRGVNILQANINPLQFNSGFPHNGYLQPELQMKQNLLEQQQRQLHEQLMPKNQMFQQLQQQQELQQELPGKLLSELTQISVVNDMNMSAMSSSLSGSNMQQGSSDSLKSSSGMVDNQCPKQEHEEKVNQNQLKKPYQQLKMQKPQMLQERQQQQIQQLQKQAKQQLHHIYFIYLIFLTILMGAYFFGTDY